jgi:hypothetical protein
MTDIEGKKKVEYNAERKAEADRDLKYVVDKIKTDARAVGNKCKIQIQIWVQNMKRRSLKKEKTWLD